MNVLAVIDKRGWAFDHHCSDLKAALTPACAIEIRTLDEVMKQKSDQLTRYDCIYLTWHAMVPTFLSAFAALRRKCLCVVPDYHTWDGNRSVGAHTLSACCAAPDLVARLGTIARVAVTCIGLQQSFAALEPALAYCGVNTEIFFPRKRKRQKKLKIGWVGSLINTKHNYRLFAHIRYLLGDFCEYEEACVATVHDRAASRQEMNHFYNSIDLLLTTSMSEGSPLPPLEALGCGTPCLSTWVGAMPEVLAGGMQGMVIDSYDPAVFAEKVRELSRDRERLAAMRAECLRSAESKWSTKKISGSWLDAFSLTA